jgi:hypothetical protein
MRVHSWKVYDHLIAQLFFGEILSILMSSIVELLISGFLGLDAPEMNTLNVVLSYWYLAIPLVVLPLIFVWLFTKNVSAIGEI